MKKASKFVTMLMTVAMSASLLAGCGNSGSSTTGGDSSSQAGSTAASESSAGSEAASSDAEQKLYIGSSYDASTLDPAMATDDASYDIVRLIGEPLLRLVDGEVQPGVAESYEVSDDSKEWIFHLRESKWVDGTPLTANDFVYTIRRAVNPDNALDNASMLYIVKNAEAYNSGTATAEDVGVEAIDDYTIKITCETPAYPATFTDYVYIPVREDMVEANGNAYGAEYETVVSNGPFTVTDWVHDSELVLTRNENYWNKDAIKLEEIHVMAGASGDTAVDMLLTDSLDATEFTTQASMQAVLDNGGFNSYAYYDGIQFIHLNHHGKTAETGKWLDNLNFRKALNAAIDREALVAAVYTTDVPASSIISSSELGVEKPLAEEFEISSWSTTQDVDAAKEYLAAAMDELGVSDVSEIPAFTMLAFDSEGNVTCLNAVADMWLNALGIKCDLDLQPITEMLSKASSGDYDFWKGGQSVGMDSVGNVFVQYEATAGSCGLNYENDEEYTKLYDAALNATTWADRKAAVAAVANHFNDNVMDLAVTWMGTYSVAKDNVGGITVSNNYIDYTYAYIK